MITRAEVFEEIKEIQWKLVLVDEYHEYKKYVQAFSPAEGAHLPLTFLFSSCFL